MLKTLDLDYKDSKKGFTNNKRDLTSLKSNSTGLANKSISLTDYAKLTDIWKRYMSNTMLLTSNS
jgi:hypothetical protein